MNLELVDNTKKSLIIYTVLWDHVEAGSGVEASFYEKDKAEAHVKVLEEIAALARQAQPENDYFDVEYWIKENELI